MNGFKVIALGYGKSAGWVNLTSASTHQVSDATLFGQAPLLRQNRERCILATVRYGIKSDGKIKVESKDEMKKRGLPSPDVADAFVLTFAEVGRGRQKVRRTRQASWRVT